MATVSLIEVSKRLGANSILETIHLDIKKGEFVVVVGPSGCGKSTLLRLIAGLDEPSSGRILINEKCVNQVPAAKRDMAMVFQNYALYPHMNVFDNMAYGLKLRRFGREEIKKRVTEIAQILHLTPYLDRKPQALSGGQKQRVAMGRAMVRSPAVFLYDEPLSNLDAKLRTEMRHEIKRLHQQFKITSLYVTHDQIEAMTMADRVLVLNQGKVEQIGTPQQLYQYPASIFVAGFLGHYPINFINGIYDQSSESCRTEQGLSLPLPATWPKPEQGTKIIVAIRPEHVQFGLDQLASPALKVNLEFVDDMGADKLVQTRCTHSGKPFHLRIPADSPLPGGQLYLELPTIKLHWFDQQTGRRMGGECV